MLCFCYRIATAKEPFLYVPRKDLATQLSAFVPEFLVSAKNPEILFWSVLDQKQAFGPRQEDGQKTCSRPASFSKTALPKTLIMMLYPDASILDLFCLQLCKLRALINPHLWFIRFSKNKLPRSRKHPVLSLYVGKFGRLLKKRAQSYERYGDFVGLNFNFFHTTDRKKMDRPRNWSVFESRFWDDFDFCTI